MTKNFAQLVWLGALAAALLSSLTPAAHAQPPSAYELGQRAFEAGRYDEALTQYQRAYDQTGDADVLYDIGLTQDLLGKPGALDSFERYLAARPDAPNRARIEARIKELRAAHGAPSGTATQSGPAEAASTAEAPHERGRGGSKIAPWLVLGGGVVVAGVGAGLLIKGSSDAKAINDVTLDDGIFWSSRAADASRADTLRKAGMATLAVGAAAAVGGLDWYAVGHHADRADRPVTVSVGPSGVLVRGRF